MPTTVTADEAFAELVTLTGISPQEWQDILSLPPRGQEIAVQSYRDADWRQDPDTFGRVLDVLQLVGTIAGVAGGASGAISAIAALRSL